MSSPPPRTAPSHRFGRWLTRELSLGALAVEAVVLVLSLLGFTQSLRDPYSDAPWFYLGIASPALLGAYFVAETLWRRAGPAWNDGWRRTLGLGGLLQLANAIVLMIVGVAAQVAGAVRPDEGQPVGWDAAGQAFFGFGLVGYAAVLFGSIPVMLLVVLPVSAFRSPGQIPGVLPVTDPREIGRNRIAVIAFSLLVFCVFAVPTCIIFGSQYNNPTLVSVGIWLFPAMVVLIVIAVVAQRGAGLLRRNPSVTRDP